MYLKFGFGRCNQDSSIDIRRGSMSRDQAIELVKLYDGVVPEKLYPDYCSYYKISRKSFIKFKISVLGYIVVHRLFSWSNCCL